MADGWRSKYGLPGIWCACIKDGQVVALVANGYKNIDRSIPALETDHLNIGSVSKVIAGSLLAQFVADVKVRYDSSVGQAFPELVTRHPNSPLSRVTLRQLMTHMAGLFTRVPRSNSKDGILWRLNVVEQAFASSEVPEPGTVYRYSNVGTCIAVSMVERLTGTSFESWLFGERGKRMGLNEPLELNYDEPDAITGVFPYILREGKATHGYHRMVHETAFDVAGNVCLTLADLCAFAKCTMYNGAHLPSSVYSDVIHMAAAIQVANSNPGAQSRPIPHTSAGWGGSGTGYLMHDGDTGRGEYCQLWVNCQTKCAIVFYTNGSTVEGFRGFEDVEADLKQLRWAKG